MNNRITYTYTQAVKMAERYARVSTRLQARLLVREDEFDGRMGGERDLRAALNTMIERADYKCRVLSRIAMLLQDRALPALKAAKLNVPAVPIQVPHGRGVFSRVAC